MARVTMSKWRTDGPTDCHYFVSSVAEWRTGTDLVQLLEHFMQQRFAFNVWRVDLPADAGYPIRMYAPAVEPEKLTAIGFFEQKEKAS